MTHTPTLHVAENGNLRIHIPLRLKRLAGRKQVIAPEGLDGVIPDATDPVQSSVVQALARAHAWAALLDNDHYPSISALARDLKLDCSYVRRILLLTTLAPDIVEAFINGEEPEGVTLVTLKRVFPEDWEEQRRALGFQTKPSTT